MKLLKPLITSFILIAFVAIGRAQEKYEQAVVSIGFGFGSEIMIYSKEGKNEIKPEKPYDPVVEGIKTVNELVRNGWEVYNTTETVYGDKRRISYFLRKKGSE